MLFGLKRRASKREGHAQALYVRAVAQARLPVFFTEGGVPDTLDGRFDLIALHVFLLLRRMKRERRVTESFAQELFDIFFADMDRNLREMGVGDMGVPRRVKAMATAFYGRIHAYDEGLDGAPGVLEAALERNLFRAGAVPPVVLARMADYMRNADRLLAGQDCAGLMNGEADFGEFQ